MEKKCDCECHKLHPIPCMYCNGRHVEESTPPAPAPGPVELFDEVHDGLTQPGASFDIEGFPF